MLDRDAWMTLTLMADYDFDPQLICGNNLKRTDTVIKQITETEELREEKLTKRNTEQI